jgi:hypothetical protein
LCGNRQQFAADSVAKSFQAHCAMLRKPDATGAHSPSMAQVRLRPPSGRGDCCVPAMCREGSKLLRNVSKLLSVPRELPRYVIGVRAHRYSRIARIIVRIVSEIVAV